jgi:hypothetical protein
VGEILEDLFPQQRDSQQGQHFRPASGQRTSENDRLRGRKAEQRNEKGAERQDQGQGESRHTGVEPPTLFQFR